MAPSLRDWLPGNHLAWFVIEAVGLFDLSAFYSAYRADGHGRAAHEPSMMVALLIYGYAIGERSSRRLERRCMEDIAFRVIAANQVPDHTTFARFRQRHELALGEVFGQVLGLCAEAGLAAVEVLAVDGTKINANASFRANVNYEQLAKKILDEAAEVDEAEDAELGERSGNLLPEEFSTAKGRRGWLVEAKHRLEQERARQAKPIPADRPERLREARRRLIDEHVAETRANESYERYRAGGVDRNGKKFGMRPKPVQMPDTPQGRVNLTDPDSRNVKTQRGWLQGYNAQAVTNEHQIVIAAELTNNSPDFGLLGPMMDATDRELTAIGITARPSVLLADAGYWHQEQIERITSSGIQVLIPPDNGKRTTARPGWSGGIYAFMRSVLQTPLGSDLYGKRQSMIEPIFGDTKFNRRCDRFQRRGRSACRSEWRLIAATHNLLKLHRHTNALPA